MTIMELKTYVSWDSIESLYYPFSRRQGFWMKLLICGIVVEMFASLFVFKYVVFSDTGSYSLAASALAATTKTTDMSLGLGITQFTKDLTTAGLSPIIIKTIARKSLAGQGVLVGLNGDNMQVFEYPDSQTALEKGNAFAKKFLMNNSLNRWKDVMHVYVRNNIIVFYMGNNKSILNTLSLNKDIKLLALNGK